MLHRHAHELGPDAQNELKGDLKEYLRTEYESHQHDQSTLLNIINVILEDCQEPLRGEVLDRDVLLGKVEIDFGHLVIQETLQFEDGFLQAKHLVSVELFDLKLEDEGEKGDQGCLLRLHWLPVLHHYQQITNDEIESLNVANIFLQLGNSPQHDR